MRIVKTQKIFYNRELRIRFLADNEDSDYTRLVRKLPDCRWSNHLNSWHTHDINDHIFCLNKSFPSHIRFYDITKSNGIPVVEENQPERRICISRNTSDNSLLLDFLYDHELTTLLKKLGANQYEENRNVWQVRNDPEISNNLNSYLEKANYLIDLENQPDELHSTLRSDASIVVIEEKFREILISRNYEIRTIEQYVYNVHRFLEWTGKNHEFSNDKIRDYIEMMSISKKYSRSYQNQQINSIKAFYHFIFNIDPHKITVKRPRKDYMLPEILSRMEADRIICTITNPKHNAIISAIYMTGITVNEAVSIEPADIDKNKMQIFIKGRKKFSGRYVNISDSLLEKIELYQNIYCPKNFLFEGYQGSKYSERSVQKALKKYVQKAGIKKKTCVHTLRHSFAGHLASEGIEIIELQNILGHSSRRSAEIYCKMVKVENKKYVV